MMDITKDILVGEILDNYPESVPFFLDIGMHCLGCPASRGETLEQACLVHGIEPEEVIQRLKEFLAPKK